MKHKSKVAMKDRALRLLEARLFIIEECIDQQIEEMPFGLDWAQVCNLSPDMADYSRQQTEIKEAINWIKSL